MTYKSLLSLDMSTTCTGWSEFDYEEGVLSTWGIVKPKVKGITKMKYPEAPLMRIKSVTEKIMDLIDYSPHLPGIILIEEISGSKNRMGQKTLDGLHWHVLNALNDRELLDRVRYYDVTGADGWRTHLRLKLSPEDKVHNKQAKEVNKSLAKGIPKIPEVNVKTLSCRFANKHYGLDLDHNVRKEDADLADSICMAHAFMHEVQW